MFLLGLEVVFVSYFGVRIYEKYSAKLLPQLTESVTTDDPPNESLSVIEQSRLLKGSREKNLHYLKMSGLTLGLSMLTHLSPAWIPITLIGFTYIAFPYLRVIEHSLLNKKKVDGYVLYGIADFMTLGLGRIATASLALGTVHAAHFVIANAEENSKQSLVDIFSQQPRTLWLLKDGVEIEVPLEQVTINDIVVVNTGEMVPVDGTVVAGVAAIDQHILTGEFQPAEKTLGDTVFASTLVLSGRIQVQVTQSGHDTTVAKITDLLNHAIDFKTNTQLQGEKWADSWNLPVLGLGFAALPFLGPTTTVVVLNGHIAQTIRIVAPLSTLNYLTIASHNGILIKDGRVLEDLPNVDVFLFDKTGTLTSEEPTVGRVLVYQPDYQESDILRLAAAAERKLAHPLARAIVNKAEELGLALPEIADAHFQIGYGISVRIDDNLIRVGSVRFMQQEGIALSENAAAEVQYAHDAGHSLIMVAQNQQLIGILEIHATVRPEVTQLLANLRQRGAKLLAIVSGDHQQPTKKLAERLGMDDYFYNVLPQNKADIVEQLQQRGHTVCFIGDGVNDTLAMKTANISISLSGATSIATDTAQIVLMDGSLRHLPDLLDIAAELKRNLNRGWLFNIVPGTLTIFGAFFWHFSIITAILLTQSGLALGVVNAILPLRRLNETPTRLLSSCQDHNHNRSLPQ